MILEAAQAGYHVI